MSSQPDSREVPHHLSIQSQCKIDTGFLLILVCLLPCNRAISDILCGLCSHCILWGSATLHRFRQFAFWISFVAHQVSSVARSLFTTMSTTHTALQDRHLMPPAKRTAQPAPPNAAGRGDNEDARGTSNASGSGEMHSPHACSGMLTLPCLCAKPTSQLTRTCMNMPIPQSRSTRATPLIKHEG